MNQSTSRSKWFGYALAVACVLAVFALRWFLEPLLHEHAPLMLFILAAMVAALYGGLGPGLLAVLLGATLGDFFFIEPRHTLGPRGLVEWTYWLTFMAEGGTAVLIVDALRRFRGRAEKAYGLAQSRGEQLRRSLREIGEAEAKIRAVAMAVESAQDSNLTSNLKGEVTSALEKKFDELRAAQQTLREQNQQLASSRQALEAERSRYRELFNSAPVGYIITNAQGIIQQVNGAAAALLNETPEMLEGLPLARMLSTEERPLFFARLNRLTRQEADVIESWETSMQPHDRALFPCSLLANRVEDMHGRLTGLRWIVRDISERKQAEEKILRLNAELEERVRQRTAALETANRELEAFSYSVSHDLRAPVRSITGFSKALLEDYSERLDAEGVKYLHYAHEAGLRMSRLIDDLIELSRATRGELRQQEVDLSELGMQVLAELRKREPGRAVEVAIAPGLRVQGDEGLLRIALENLLANAWKFTGRQPRPRIELGAMNENGARMFYVRDNGAGFNMTNASRLFGVFQRLHSEEEFPGTGIGLATVRRIFTRHGGEIWADAKVNEGATFYFTLPNGIHAEANEERTAA